MSTNCRYEFSNSLNNKKNILDNNSIISLNRLDIKRKENAQFTINSNNDKNRKEFLLMLVKNKNNEEKGIMKCRTAANPEIISQNLNDANYNKFFKKEKNSDMKINNYKSTKETFYSNNKKEIKEVEYIPIENDLSLVFNNNSILNSSDLKERSNINNNVNNNDKKDSNLFKIFKERNKRFIKEHNRTIGTQLFLQIFYIK